MTEFSWARLPEIVPGWLLAAWLTAFGLVVGSFLNVVIHRLPRGRFPGPRRSACPSCGRQIRWYENVPIVSWLALRGRCAGCGSPISVRYLVVEALAGALALGCWLVFGWSLALAFALAFGWAMIALVFTDLEHMILPDAITLPGTFLALALSWWNPLIESPADALLGVLLAIFVVEGMNLVYKLLRGRDGFGAGDTKMLMLVGATLGWKLGLFTLVAGSVLGALAVIPILALRREEPADEAEDEVANESAPEEEPAERPGLAAVLLPHRAEDLLAPLAFLALAMSFVTPGTARPENALLGLLVGLALMAAINRVADRRRGGPPEHPERATELLPLAGAIAGLPPRPLPAVAAGAVLLLWAVSRPVLNGLLPAEPQPAEGEAREAPAPASALQAELPFGVFLGIGAVVSLLAGEDVIAWYLGLFPAALPPG